MTAKRNWLLAGALLLAAGSAPAADDCIEFAWDVRAEHALFAMQPARLTAGIDAATAPAVSPDRLYELHFARQTEVRFPTAPGGRAPAEGAYAGLVHLKLAVPGAYRISSDQPLWIDVALGGALLKPQDFQGRKGCNAPHKIVEFSLPMGVELTLQFSDVRSADAKITITPTP
jgi:hypothetical protein